MGEQKSEKQIPYESGWPDEQRHNPDPNRVPNLQMPSPGHQGRRTPAGASLPPTPETAMTRLGGLHKTRHDAGNPPGKTADEPSYYDLSFLKPPLWKWEIASYFFLGGVSSAAYILSRVAERFGGEKFRDLSRVGANLAFVTFLPCPPLLILDLGDPKRFHHMMRVWKPTSPMNLGTWAIVGYSGMATAEVVRQWLLGKHPARRLTPGARRANHFFQLLHDVAGIPFALLVAGYTGVLLSCTANPLWCKNPWLGPLFSASALATGTEAIELALRLRGKSDDDPAIRSLDKIDTAAHAAEIATMAGYLKHAGPLAKPLTHGSMKYHLYGAAAGIAVAEVVKRLPLKGKAGRFTKSIAAVAGLAAGFSLRWAMVHGGREAALDPHSARRASRPKGGVLSASSSDHSSQIR